MISYLKKFVEELILAIFPPSSFYSSASSSYLNLYGPKISRNGLFLWEDKAIKKFFPPPPARILVGAAGSGREMIVLSSRGYCFSGFEPIIVSANHAKSQVPKDKLLAFNEATYEDLVRGSLKEIESYSPYDAAILGWGSITHILDPEMRKLVLTKFRRLCPSGPILLSWIRASYISSKVKLLRKFFSFLGLKNYPDRDYFKFEMGFCHTFTKDEMFNLVKYLGDSIIFYEDEKTNPHAVLLPTI